MWCGAESNRRHKDFQSFALPTELPHHIYLILNIVDLIFNRGPKIKQVTHKTENAGKTIRACKSLLAFPCSSVPSSNSHTRSKT